jgi:hypothetical protein
MKTLTEVYDLIETMNEEAHQEAYDSWAAADELMESDDEDDWETAEEMREDASSEQAGYFREAYWDLDKEDQEAIKHWLKEDPDFREEFVVWFGEEEFIDEFESN